MKKFQKKFAHGVRHPMMTPPLASMMRKLILRSIGGQMRKILTKNAKNYFFGPKCFAEHFFVQRRKMKRWESSETNLRKFSWRTDMILRGKHTFKVSKKIRNSRVDFRKRNIRYKNWYPGTGSYVT